MGKWPRRRLLLAFEAAELEPDPGRRAGWLTFVIVGGGPTGVELAGAIVELAHETLRKDFRAMLSRDHRELVETNFATHADPTTYYPRGVLLYGVAEIVRSRMCVDLLESGQIEAFGRMMKISHDGDRVSRPGPDGSYRLVAGESGDEYLQRLIGDLGSENPQRVLRAQLFMQPGAYASSTPKIDQMVDIAASVQGVAGAQIAGAGLGGCIMVLVRHDSVTALRKALALGYYRPHGLDPAAMPWRNLAH